MKHVMVRMKEDLFEDFDKLCKEKGYTKGGLIKSLVKKLLKEEKFEEFPEEELSAEEMKEVIAGLAEVVEKKTVKLKEIKGEL